MGRIKSRDMMYFVGARFKLFWFKKTIYFQQQNRPNKKKSFRHSISFLFQLKSCYLKLSFYISYLRFSLSNQWLLKIIEFSNLFLGFIKTLVILIPSYSFNETFQKYYFKIIELVIQNFNYSVINNLYKFNDNFIPMHWLKVMNELEQKIIVSIHVPKWWLCQFCKTVFFKFEILKICYESECLGQASGTCSKCDEIQFYLLK